MRGFLDIRHARLFDRHVHFCHLCLPLFLPFMLAVCHSGGAMMQQGGFMSGVFASLGHPSAKHTCRTAVGSCALCHINPHLVHTSERTREKYAFPWWPECCCCGT